MLWKFELCISSGYRDLSGQSLRRFLGYRFIQERSILLTFRYNKWQVAIYQLPCPKISEQNIHNFWRYVSLSTPDHLKHTVE